MKYRITRLIRTWEIKDVIAENEEEAFEHRNDPREDYTIIEDSEIEAQEWIK